MDSPGLIPLFPLELVLYPDELLPLHIFEQRYKDMMRDCLESERAFGVVLYQDGRMSRVGCTARIKEIVREYPDGQMDIIVSGGGRFRVVEINRQRSYLRADAEPFEGPGLGAEFEDRERAITQHMKLLELAGRAPSPSAYQNRKQLSYFLALNAGLSVEQKQALLELPSEQERIEFLISHMAEFIPRVKQAESFRRKISSNGHFPDFPPPKL